MNRSAPGTAVSGARVYQAFSSLAFLLGQTMTSLPRSQATVAGVPATENLNP
jgi:hypothetical protein